MTRATSIKGIESETNMKLLNSLHIMLKNILVTSIAKLTNGKVNLIIKHCNESSFSPGDMGRFVDRLHVDGYKIKMIFVDYLDVMVPTVSKFSSNSEYDSQGTITQELRSLSRIHGVPVFSPTQSKRDTESLSKVQSNESIGDSYKKVRYSDFIYMAKMRSDLNFLSEAVRPHVIQKKQSVDGSPAEYISPEILKLKDKLVDVLTPYEVKITKSKDSEKDISRFLLFCKDNLRIYNNIDEYIKDYPIIEANTLRLEKDINILTDLAIASVSSDDFIEDEYVSNTNVIEFGNPF